MAPVTEKPATPATTDDEPRRMLAEAVVEIEQHVATGGWDGPVRVFALVRTAQALRVEPTLAQQLPPQVLAAAALSSWHLTSIEQEGLPAADDLESLLGGISWPKGVDGAAVTVERIILPPEAEAGLPKDPDAALAALLAHPSRQDVRLAVGVLRKGVAWCAVRTRPLPGSEGADGAADPMAGDVGQGPDIVPGLIQALRATFA